MAGYVYASERYKMEQEFEKIAATCRVAGMSESKVEEIHRMMLDEINNNRKFFTHTLSYDGLQFSDGDKAEEGISPLIKYFLKEFSTMQAEICDWGRYDWIEDIETPELITWIKSLSEDEIYLLTLMVVDDMRQTNIAKLLGKHDSAISRKVKSLRKSLAKILPDTLKKQYKI